MELQEILSICAHRDANGCLIWHDTVTAQGYPILYSEGTQLLVHRAVYIERKQLEDNEIVHHKCEVKRCVEFDHLEAKTRAQHMAEHKNRSGKYAKFCKAGHAMSMANVYIHPKTGWRQCMICKCARDQERRVQARGTRPKGIHTHCHKGHKLTDDNIMIMGGVRRCKACYQERRGIKVMGVRTKFIAWWEQGCPPSVN